MHAIYEKVPPTRHELILLKEQEINVRIGFEILKNKDDIMVKEFFSQARTLHSERELFNTTLKKAYASLALAQEIHGVRETKYLAASTIPVAPPELGKKKVAGVVLPIIRLNAEKRNAFNRGYAPASTSRELEHAASRFEESLEKAISVGEKESSAKKLGTEILKARRRSRALEQELLPSIRREIHGIKNVIDMRTRETFSRTKRIKSMLGS